LAGTRMFVRVLLVVEVVDQSCRPPEPLILPQLTGIGPHRRLDGVHVAPQALALHPLMHQPQHGTPIRNFVHHLNQVTLYRRSLWRRAASAAAANRTQYSAFPGVRGYGMTSRMFAMPVAYWMARSSPSPNPACGTVPY